MAGPDPRRSSRARTNQPVSRPSSTTSSVSGRIERHSKHFVKTGSPQKSTSTASLASEPPDDAAGTDDNTPPPPTRSRRATHSNVIKDDDPDQSSVVVSEIEMTNDGDDIQEDDEAVRCICGYEDYPGPPAAEDIEQGAKDGYDVEAIFPAVVTDDLAGFFVQCDICKVWQHGACVGLVNDATLPEEYYCEECRKDLHKIFPGTNSHRCSIYLALNRRRSRTSSFNKNRERTPQLRDSSKDSKDGDREIGPDGVRESKSSRALAASQAAKRRSTMNSRDAAYDEEQLLIALAASREDGSDPADPTPRRPKRSRSDSEEKADMTKRQRTSSRSVSPLGDKSIMADDSDDAMATRNGSSKKASRSAALARSQAQRERAEKEEKERQRAEAASKRNGRAERRRVDESDPSDEAPLATTRAAVATRITSAPAPPTATPATASTSGNTSATPTNAPSLSATPVPATAPRSAPPRPSQPSPETPPPTSAPAMAQSKSKGGRPTHKKKGRNQYTKERDAREELNSTTRSRSRDVPESGQGKSSSSGGGSHGHQNNKSGSRSKGGGANSRVSLNEMRRRVSAMSDFIGKTQIDIASGEYLASAVATPDGGKAGSGNAATNPSSAATTPSSTSAPQLPVTTNGVSSDGAPEKDFKKLPLLDMMDTLTRNIIHWQNQYGN